MNFIEIPVGAILDDVIEFLEKECQQFTPIHGEGFYVNFYSQRQNNKISIFAKMWEISFDRATSKYIEPDNEFMRFEVSRVTDNRSLVKGFYDRENRDAQRMFYTRVTRLGIAFGENWASSVQEILNEIISEQDKGFTPIIKIGFINGELQQVLPLLPPKKDFPNTDLDQNHDLDTSHSEIEHILDDKLDNERDRKIARIYQRGGNWKDVSELLGGRSYQTVYRHVNRIRTLCGKTRNGEWAVPFHKSNRERKKRRIGI